MNRSVDDAINMMMPSSMMPVVTISLIDRKATTEESRASFAFLVSLL